MHERDFCRAFAPANRHVMIRSIRDDDEMLAVAVQKQPVRGQCGTTKLVRVFDRTVSA